MVFSLGRDAEFVDVVIQSLILSPDELSLVLILEYKNIQNYETSSQLGCNPIPGFEPAHPYAFNPF